MQTEKQKTWYQNNRERILKKMKANYIIKRDKILEYQKDYRSKNKDKCKEDGKKWRNIPANVVKEKERKRRNYIDNKEEILLRNKKYRATAKGKESMRASQRKWEKNNPVRGRIRCSIKRIIRNANAGQVKPVNKYGIVIKDLVNKMEIDAICLGYTAKELISMNYHIDHIIPISLYNISDENEIQKCCSPLNLRWLPAKENLIKGDRLELEDLEIIKTLPQEIYPEGFNLEDYNVLG